MLTNDLESRLLLLDEEANLIYNDNEKLYCIIVGGSALMLLGYINRATHDIDSIECHHKLFGLIEKYDLNDRIKSEFEFSYNEYCKRYRKE